MCEVHTFPSHFTHFYQEPIRATCYNNDLYYHLASIRSMQQHLTPLVTFLRSSLSPGLNQGPRACDLISSAHIPISIRLAPVATYL